MAIFRTVQVSIWQDDFVIDLTPEEKFFFVYLLTNSRTTQCGIFCLSKRIIEFETGYNRETVEKLINRFIDYGKILYNETTKEIIILSWIKYNFINSRNTICCINKELKNVKNKGFVKIFFNLCQKYNYPLDSIFKDIDLSDFTNKPAEIQKAEENKGQDNQEPDNNLEVHSESLVGEEIQLQSETSTATTLKDVVDFFNNNFHAISPHECENIASWSEEMEYGVILLAAKEAVTQNARKMSYINGILNNWLSLGLTTVDKVKCQMYKWEKEKNPPNEGGINCNSEAYEYLD